MWTRRELKERAKSVLRTNYWKAFLISLVIGFATGGIGGGGSSGRGGGAGGGRLPGFFGPDASPEKFVIAIALIVLGAVAVLALALALRIFLGYPLEVGGQKYFMESARYGDNRGCFRYAFNSRNYTGIITSMLRKGIQNFLWFLLFIIPGIVKYYAYSMVPYILADNPNIGGRRAIELSKKMTNGHKADIFVLDLSFLGWILLGVLALGIGVLFVMPYIYATKAELYLRLREIALQNNLYGEVISETE